MRGRKKKNTTGVPDYVIEAFARTLIPSIQAYYATEEGQKAFEEWKCRQDEAKNKNRSRKSCRKE